MSMVVSGGRLVATCGDRSVRVSRNIPEYHGQAILNLKDGSGDALRRHMHEQIEEAKVISKSIVRKQ
ncbi:unnamed protein product [Haemonchus placei]|uniref:PPM-type phosphatase domain-containing protein n=1 Tax=Haemonchus placei TaxID=6290 RepID=A0A0N4WKN4_HAEPC|nr:unnamed protein product [Haemonchus placei]